MIFIENWPVRDFNAKKFFTYSSHLLFQCIMLGAVLVGAAFISSNPSPQVPHGAPDLLFTGTWVMSTLSPWEDYKRKHRKETSMPYCMSVRNKISPPLNFKSVFLREALFYLSINYWKCCQCAVI